MYLVRLSLVCVLSGITLTLCLLGLHLAELKWAGQRAEAPQPSAPQPFPFSRVCVGCQVSSDHIRPFREGQHCSRPGLMLVLYGDRYAGSKLPGLYRENWKQSKQSGAPYVPSLGQNLGTWVQELCWADSTPPHTAFLYKLGVWRCYKDLRKHPPPASSSYILLPPSSSCILPLPFSSCMDAVLVHASQLSAVTFSVLGFRTKNMRTQGLWLRH